MFVVRASHFTYSQPKQAAYEPKLKASRLFCNLKGLLFSNLAKLLQLVSQFSQKTSKIKVIQIFNLSKQIIARLRFW